MGEIDKIDTIGRYFRKQSNGFVRRLTTSSIEVTDGSETNGFGLPFSDPLLLRRAINIGIFLAADENKKTNTRGIPLRSSEILMRDPLMNLWSIFPKERI